MIVLRNAWHVRFDFVDGGDAGVGVDYRVEKPQLQGFKGRAEVRKS